MSDPDTLRVYADQQAEYRAMVEAEARDDPIIGHFITDCLAGGRVLDLGCGPGQFAALMAEAGLQVDAMDAVPEQVAHAQARDGVTAWQGRFDELTAQNTYDAIWAYFSLLHAPSAAFPDHLAAIKRALKPGGLFLIAMKRGTGGRPDRLGRHYEYYERDVLEDHLRHAGLTPQRHWTGKAKGLTAHTEGWIAVQANG